MEHLVFGIFITKLLVPFVFSVEKSTLSWKKYATTGSGGSNKYELWKAGLPSVSSFRLTASSCCCPLCPFCGPSKVLSGAPWPSGLAGSTSPKWGLTVPGSAPDPQSIRLSRFAGPRAVPAVTIAPISPAPASSPRENFRPEISSKLSKLSKRLPRSVVFGVWLSLHRAVRDRPGVWRDWEEEGLRSK